jgi:ubiquinone/menaquinone biosynthesis C-methylase UbiE
VREEHATYRARLAAIYDSIYSFKNYAQESDYVWESIRRLAPGARTLLETACGSGRFLEHLRRHADVEGLDLSPEMLALAAKRVPGVDLHQGDMADFDLGRSYDAVCCLFRSIAYVRTKERLGSAIRCMARHLNVGGVLLVEPFFTPDNFHVGRITLNRYEDEHQKVSWMYSSRRRGLIGCFDIHYLVGNAEGVEHFSETHELGLFTGNDFAAAFAEAGLQMVRDESGPGPTGLYLGVREEPAVSLAFTES